MIATAHKLLFAGALVVAAALFAHPEAAAQPASRFQSDEVDRSFASGRRNASSYLDNGAGDREQFEGFFTRYYFPSMTQSSADGLGKAGKLSSDLFTRYLYKGNGEPQQWLSKQALEWGMRVTRGGRYHPSVRLNALLVVGRIDDVYSAENPTPSSAANDFLRRVVGSAATNARAPRYLLTGALTGLERHTRHSGNLDRNQQRQTARVLVGVLGLNELAGDYEEGVKDWVYLQAGTALSNLGNAGKKGSLVAPLAKRVADDSLSLNTRAKLASLLEPMQGSAPAEMLDEPMMRLAAAVAEQESEVAKKYEQTQVGSQRIKAGSATRDGSGSRMRPETLDRSGEVVLVREPIVEILNDLRTGMQAASRLGGGEKLTEISEAIQPALKVASQTDQSDVSVAAEVRRMDRTIQVIAAPMLAPAAEEEEMPEDLQLEEAL